MTIKLINRGTEGELLLEGRLDAVTSPEAEEIFLSGKSFNPNRLIFVHYPYGNIFEPMKSEEGQYFGMPAYIEGSIYILLV